MRLITICIYTFFITLRAAAAEDRTNPLTLCSSQNTGADGDTALFSSFNSFGSCTEHCSGYAYAIMQGKNCWCSNIKPSDTTSVDNCSDGCPGFQSDSCGNLDQGLFGYAQLAQPSGTLESSAASSSTASSETSSFSSTASSSTETTSSSSSLSSSTSITSTASSTTSSGVTSTSSISSTVVSTSSNTTTSETRSTSPTTYITTIVTSSVTANSTSTSSSDSSSQTTPHADSTVTVTTSPTADPASASASASASSSAVPLAGLRNTNKGYWSNGGAVAGTFVGVGVGVVIILALIFFYFRRRRRHEKLGIVEANPPMSGSPDALKVHTQGFSNLVDSPGSHNLSASLSDNEVQFVPIFDQRVDPNQFYMRWEKAGSRASLQDNEDYSRKVLRVANPDKK